MNLADRAKEFLYKGIREVGGSASHPQIYEWLKRTEKIYPTDLKIDDSTYAWCGVFVGCMVLDERLANPTFPKPPSYFQGAKNWLKWGTKVEIDRAQRGDVIVVKRTGGHHVTIISSITKNGFACIGGNQSDSISIVEYPFSKVVGVRRG